MHRFVGALGAVVWLAGCAPPAKQPAREPVAVNTVAPRCTAGVDCDRKWLSAQEVLQQVTGMRLRIVTETRLETFAPTSFGRMGGSVVKYPADGGGFELRLQLECYRSVECSDLRNAGVNLFNRTVAAAN